MGCCGQLGQAIRTFALVCEKALIICLLLAYLLQHTVSFIFIFEKRDTSLVFVAVEGHVLVGARIIYRKLTCSALVLNPHCRQFTQGEFAAATHELRGGYSAN